MDSRHAHGGNSSGEEDRSASNSGSGGGRAATAAEPVQGEPGDKELPGRGQQAATALDVDAEDTGTTDITEPLQASLWAVVWGLQDTRGLVVGKLGGAVNSC